jgi:hypothetical protein
LQSVFKLQASEVRLTSGVEHPDVEEQVERKRLTKMMTWESEQYAGLAFILPPNPTELPTPFFFLEGALDQCQLVFIYQSKFSVPV